jgi:transcription initiation factor IIE alpha subunit
VYIYAFKHTYIDIHINVNTRIYTHTYFVSYKHIFSIISQLREEKRKIAEPAKAAVAKKTKSQVYICIYMFI